MSDMQIGPYTIENPLALAPMVGVTDRFFRQLCRELGAGYLVTEMLASDPALRDTRKARLRGDFTGEVSPIAVQIAGSDPQWMADAARYNVARGAGMRLAGPNCMGMANVRTGAMASFHPAFAQPMAKDGKIGLVDLLAGRQPVQPR